MKQKTKLVDKHRLTTLIFGEIFRPQKFNIIKFEQNYYFANFHIFRLFGKFDIGRKVFKNRGLIPLHFGQIFRHKEFF